MMPRVSQADLYCEFMAQAAGWERKLTKSVAAQVRRYREHRGMTAQELSDRCAELGVRIPRPVLTNLETGRRESVTLAELIVLAQALSVPPTLLIAPVATDEDMEILPGRIADTADVLEWFAGEARFTPESESGLDMQVFFWRDEPYPAGLVHLYRLHTLLVGLLMDTTHWRTHDPSEWRPEDGGPGQLRFLRGIMRAGGFRVPALPPELADLDSDQGTADGPSDRMRHAVRRA